MSVTVTPTGRTRLRLHKTWFRKPVLVLQLQFRHEGYYLDPNPMVGTIDINHTTWRDANVGDITLLDAGTM